MVEEGDKKGDMIEVFSVNLICNKNGTVASTCHQLKNLIFGSSHNHQSQNRNSGASTYVASNFAGGDEYWILGSGGTHRITNGFANPGNSLSSHQ